MKIIAFGHRKLVGKDCACNFLVTHLRLKYPGINVAKKGFADKVKQITRILYGWTGIKDDNFYEQFPEKKGEIVKELGMSIREKWIDIGRAFRASLGTDVWSNAILKEKSHDVLFIKDLRYYPEFTAIKAAGGICIKINKSDVPDQVDGADEVLANCEDWDMIIENNGNLKSFNLNLINLLEEIIMRDLPFEAKS